MLEARDSMTGALLGRVFDRRETRQSGRVQWATSVSNRADFSQLFKSWANICVKGMGELKENFAGARRPATEPEALIAFSCAVSCDRPPQQQRVRPFP